MPHCLSVSLLYHSENDRVGFYFIHLCIPGLNTGPVFSRFLIEILVNKLYFYIWYCFHIHLTKVPRRINYNALALKTKCDPAQRLNASLTIISHQWVETLDKS